MAGKQADLMEPLVVAHPASALPITRESDELRPARPNALVSRWADGWLVGGLGIGTWFLFQLPGWGIADINLAVSGPIYWMLLALTGTHFGISYHLAYGEGRDVVRSRWLPLIAIPVGLLALGVVICLAAFAGATRLANEGARLLLATVFTLTTWHYVKQVYGVARVGASLRSLSLEGREANILRYGLYPLWFMSAARVWAGNNGRSFDGLEAGYDLLPWSVVNAMEILTWITVPVIAATLLRAGLRWRTLPATIWTPYVVSFLWFLATPSYASVVLVFGAVHALQYLACAHRAEVSWGIERAGGHQSWWWGSVFGGAMATGMLLVYWLPRLVTDATESTAIAALPAALLFGFFNLHHYAVDASIWRFGGEQIRRITKGPRIG